MLDNLGKKIMLMFFEKIIKLPETEKVGFEMWKGEITKNNVPVNPNILDNFQVDIGLPI